jgi:hypothetical protein
MAISLFYQLPYWLVIVNCPVNYHEQSAPNCLKQGLWEF